MTLTNALKWSFLSELASKAVQPVVFVVLARLLTPQDFGVMAAALMVLAFSQIFWEAGMGKALIQRRTDVEAAANAAFWINVALGFAIATGLYFAAPLIARGIFQDDRVGAVLRVMTVQVLLGAMSSVHTALLQKEMHFQRLFWVRFASVGLPGLASIPLAWHGLGYWALVAGTICGQAAQVVLLWRASRWRPSRHLDTAVVMDMARFGGWVGASGLLGWFYSWADSFVVGAYLGSHDLGLYRTGHQFAGILFTMLFGPAAPVLYSHLARFDGDQERMRHAVQKVLRTLTSVAVPIGIVVFSVSNEVDIDLFGANWSGIGFVIGAMALMQGFSWIVGLNGEVYRAMGKPRYEAAVPAVMLVGYLAAYVWSAGVGFQTFVWTRVVLALAALQVHLIVIGLLLQVSVRQVLAHIATVAAISSASAFGVHLLLGDRLSSGWPSFIGVGILSVATIGAFLFLLERNGLAKDLKILFAERSA